MTRSDVGRPLISSLQVSVVPTGISVKVVTDRMYKPGALVGSGRTRTTNLLGKAGGLVPPPGPKFTMAALMLEVTLKLTVPGSDGLGGGLVALPSGPNSRNNFVVVLALFGPATLISMVDAAAPNAVTVCPSTVPDV